MQKQVMSLKDASRKYPVLNEYIPIECFPDDMMCSVWYDHGLHFSIFDPHVRWS